MLGTFIIVLVLTLLAHVGAFELDSYDSAWPATQNAYYLAKKMNRAVFFNAEKKVAGMANFYGGQFGKHPQLFNALAGRDSHNTPLQSLEAKCVWAGLAVEQQNGSFLLIGSSQCSIAVMRNGREVGSLMWHKEGRFTMAEYTPMHGDSVYISFNCVVPITGGSQGDPMGNDSAYIKVNF